MGNHQPNHNDETTNARSSEEILKIEYDFTSKLCDGLLRKFGNNGNNLVVSPLSIFVTLSMVMCGAEGKTLKEMMKTLSFEGDFAKIKEGTLKTFMIESVQNIISKKDTLNLANSIYLAKSLILESDFKDLMKNSFRACLNQTDFSQGAVAAKEINDWVSENTGDKIQNLVGPSSINANTMMILVNAITFFGVWKNAFDKTNTTEYHQFYTTNGAIIGVPLMSQSYIEIPYGQDDGYKWVNLPYKTPGFSMTLVIPQTPSSSVSTQTDTKFNEWFIKRLSKKSNVKFPTSTQKITSLVVPRFEISFSSSLNEILTQEPFIKFGVSLSRNT